MTASSPGASNVHSRVVLVTGGTGGIGRAVAVRLAQDGNRVLFIGRDAARATRVLAALEEVAPGLKHAYIPADLSLLSDTAAAAAEVERHTDQLDSVVLCAGIFATVPEWTSEGLERSFVLNYLSRYLLARLLLPSLLRSRSGRMVLVANAGVYPDTLDFDDLQHRRGRHGLAVAGRTQFANDLLAVELAARVSDTRVEVSCVAPGPTATDVFRNARGLPPIIRVLAPAIQRLVGRSPESAAYTPALLAQDDSIEGVNGSFFGRGLKRLRIPERALRIDRRRLLWQASEELVRRHLPVETPPQLG
ncbi:SDR family NAD(P)-dependent oxidoreductase [Micromonospora chersina]|uniref:SDR family NAD(P)-dependent oxidoreductase n=1 Tax=Micromonospora chersina TaxID=47854 RepID=UPI00371477A1